MIVLLTCWSHVSLVLLHKTLSKPVSLLYWRKDWPPCTKSDTTFNSIRFRFTRCSHARVLTETLTQLFSKPQWSLHKVDHFQNKIDANLLPYDNYYFNNLLCKLDQNFSCQITDFLKCLGPSKLTATITINCSTNQMLTLGANSIATVGQSRTQTIGQFSRRLWDRCVQ